MIIRMLNWLNGWRWDMDGFLVRARRHSDPSRLNDHDGFIDECAIATRSHLVARLIDAEKYSVDDGE